MRAVYEVRATGPAHTHQTMATAITAALAELRGEDTPVTGLDADERAAWVWAVTDATVIDVATSPVGCSVLVEVDTIDSYGPRVPHVLAAGFDTLVLDRALAVPGVTETSTGGPILRPTTPTEETPR